MFFICTNQQQIFNMVNLTFGKKNIDLIIFDYNTQNYELYKNLKKEKEFNSIYYLPIKKYMKNSNLMNFIKNLVSIKKSINKYIKIYRNHLLTGDFYFSYPDLPTLLLFKKLQRLNILDNIYIYEEGLYTYTKSLSKKNQLASFLTRVKIENMVDKTLVYKPILMPSDTISQVREIDSNNFSNNYFIDFINSIFDYKEINLEGPIIFLDQPLPKSKNYSLILNCLSSRYPNDLVVKKHPRSDLKNELKFIETSLPFELIMLNNNIRNKILITFYSSAVISPIILFNQQPIVLFLYKLLDNELETSGIEIYINKLKTLYDNPKNIHIPENIEELNRILNEISLENR